MSWLILLIVAGWALPRLGAAIRNTSAYKKASAPRLRYLFDARQNRALALAHPIADARVLLPFANPKAPALAPAQAQALRASVLHIIGLRASLSDDAVREALPALLRQTWFRIDLDKLRADDDARAALAFACARVAFAVRAATLLGWLDAAPQWALLHQNAQRAQDCFASWEDYGRALMQGRQQWIAGARADSLGAAFDAARLAAWLANRKHPWRTMAWQGPQQFTPPS